jgi:hypothetical protein
MLTRKQQREQHKGTFGYRLWSVVFAIFYPFLSLFTALFTGVLQLFSLLSQGLVRLLGGGRPS